MFVFDSHLDLAWNVVEWNRNYKEPVKRIRLSEKDLVGVGRGNNTVSYPELKRGEVFCSLASILTRKVVDDFPPFVPFGTAQETVVAALRQVEHYQQMVEESELVQLKTQGDLKRHFDVWNSLNETPPGFILSMEGADPILTPRELGDWWKRGLRVIGLVHYGDNRYSHGTGSRGGLKKQGIELLHEMQEIGFVLDVTHLTDRAFSETLDIFEGPLVASHHNCRAIVPCQRQLTDEQIRILIERDGVIGVAFDNWMLKPGWTKGISSRQIVSIQSVADHIDHICQCAGDSRNVGIGSDLDGGFGTDQCPVGLETIADIQKLIPVLDRRGYKTTDIEQIMFRNWLRFFIEHLPE